MTTTFSIEDFRSTKPGIYTGIPFPEYLRLPILSQSTLKEGRKSMAHLKASIDGERVRKVTDDMTLGSALHTCFLEPEMMLERVVVWAKGTRRGKEWEAFCDEHETQIILTEAYHEKLVGMVKALRAKKIVREWFSKVEAVEVSAIGTFEGLPFKCRCDAMTDDPLWDLKKTRCTDDRTINSTIVNFGYHIQAYIYREIFGRSRFCLGFVEDTYPHDVRVVELSDNWLKIGKAEATGLAQAHKHCLSTSVWPGRSEIVEKIEPPAYMTEQSGTADEITFDGEAAF